MVNGADNLVSLSRYMTALFIAFVGGGLGFGFLFGDSTPLLSASVAAATVYLLAGFLIGLLLPHRWWLAGLAAWPGLIVAGMIVSVALRR